MRKVPNDVALSDFERFLSEFRVDPIKRKKMFETNEDGKSIVSGVIELIEEGMAFVDDDCHLTYTLLEPITSDSGNVLLNECVFKNTRITLEQYQKIQSEKDELAKMIKILSVITGSDGALFRKISMDDMNYLTTISLVFM